MEDESNHSGKRAAGNMVQLQHARLWQRKKKVSSILSGKTVELSSGQDIGMSTSDGSQIYWSSYLKLKWLLHEWGLEKK
jgi:hypothetical protein